MLNFFYYIKYFFYIAFNWNLRLASFSIYHEIRGERKYNINTSRLNDLVKLDVKGSNRKEAEIYQGAGYFLLEKIFQQLQILRAPDGIIDIGSGKGRVMVVAAHYGFKEITGIDFAKELCLDAEKNCNNITLQFPGVKWKVINANAADFKFRSEDQVFFFFNPFKETVMKQVIRNMLQSQHQNPRRIMVVYMNPQHGGLFLKNGFKQAWYLKKMEFVDAVIYEKNL